MLRLIEIKVQDILKDPYRFKPLRKPLQNKRRVHVGGSFVLVYEINEHASSTMKCNTWESRKGDAILSVYAKELQTYYHGRKRTHS